MAIKQAGTNGGGFFGPNSTHPFENPTPWSNLLSIVSIVVLPMASIVMAGLMLKNMQHAAVIYGVMLAFLRRRGGRGDLGRGPAERRDRGPAGGLGARTWRARRSAFGPVASATWAAMTTATSNGSVNSMHDSLNPIAGLVPMAMMMLNVVFSGIGAGFENMLMYIIVAVFLAGLMVGRTPEYLGKKVEAKEVKLAMIAMLIHPLLICAGAGLFAATLWGKATVANPGPHGFSEILYEFTSAVGQQRLGVRGAGRQQPGLEHRHGHRPAAGPLPALILPLAIAGFLSQKKRVPADHRHAADRQPDVRRDAAGTVLLVGALSFMPAVVLGPVADHLAA